MNPSLKVLFISYDGVLEPLGRSQVLPYVEGLASRGVAMSLLSFEKPADLTRTGQARAVREALTARGIRWTPLRYHRVPPVLSTVMDLVIGTVRAWAIIRRQRIRMVHARSEVAALIAWGLKRITGTPFLFDMRGFLADERAEAGAWSSTGPVYRMAKRCERRLLNEADEVITLTEQARRTIESWLGTRGARITVIPTCVDLERFTSPEPARVLREAPVFIYAGSVAPWYLLPEVLRFVQQAVRRFPRTRLLILTRERDAAHRCLRESTLAPEHVTVASVDPSDVPGRMAQAHAGLALYRPGFSRRGTCPTKIGEYLAMGLPVIANSEVGDVEGIIGRSGVGVVLPELSAEAYDAALDRLQTLWADPTLAGRCRQVAESRFSLEIGVERYWAIYRRLSVGSASAGETAVGSPVPAPVLEHAPR